MRDYREKTINGMIADVSKSISKTNPLGAKVTIRMTNDYTGQTLSLSAGNFMITIPLEQVSEIIKVTEADK